jgi:hypothetical protein
MASLVLAGNTSGSITISSPSVSGTNTLTLPASTGTVLLKDSNNIVSVSGVQFPATQSASADANTLDDYEEGTWTPTVAGGSTAGTYTYSTRAGSYIKIGRIVVASFTLTAITASSAGTGGLTITGFPFTAGGNSSYGDRAFNAVSRIRLMANARSNVIVLLGANSTIGYYVYDNGSTGGGTDIPVTDISSGNSQLGATLVYLTD